MATPHVAGIAGLLKSHNSNLTATAIEDLLTGSCEQFNQQQLIVHEQPIT
jgi:subtilisin family serine protease